MQELQEYRDEGYSNAQIAAMLGVCERTIYRHLGAERARKPYKRRSEAPQENQAEQQEKKQLLKPIEKRLVFEGAQQVYTVYSPMGIVAIEQKDPNEKRQYNAQQLEAHIAELLDVLQVLKGEQEHGCANGHTGGECETCIIANISRKRAKLVAFAKTQSRNAWSA